MSSSVSVPSIPVLRESSSDRVVSGSIRTVNWPLIVRFITLVVLTVACYWPALNGEFQWDDGVLVRDNEMLRSLSGLWDIWASTKPFDFFPLTYSSFWLEWPLWGADPAGYHLVNLVLHLTGACLLWRLLLAMRIPGAWFGALLFALHPVNVASVAWIAERKNTLSMVFYLACLLNFWKSEIADDDHRRLRAYQWSLGFFVLAALSKSSVVMLPFVLLLLCWWHRSKLRRIDLARSIPFVAISFACGVATMWFQYHRAMDPEFHDEGKMPLMIRVLMSGHSAWFYLGKSVMPVRLAMLYPHWKLAASSVGDFLPVIGWILLLTVAWMGKSRWGRGPFAVLAYFVITLAPVAGLFHMSYFTYSYVSDHLIHLSLIGIIAGIAASLGRWQNCGGASAWAASLVMVVIVACYSVAAFQRADQFSSPRKLWESTRVIDPGCFAVYNNLGVDAQMHGRIPEAESNYREALYLEPRSFSAGNGLANILHMEGKWRESAELYQAILRLQPDAQCYNNLGVVFLELGEAGRARDQFKRALALEPSMTNAYHNLYWTEKGEGHPAAAAEALRECLRVSPADAQAMTALASLSLELIPKGSEPAESGAAAYESTVRMAERACQLTGYRNPQSLAALSKAQFASGQHAEALETGRSALAEAAENHQAAFIEEFTQTLTAMDMAR